MADDSSAKLKRLERAETALEKHVSQNTLLQQRVDERSASIEKITRSLAQLNERMQKKLNGPEA